MRESLYIVIPAYNEEKNLRKLIEQWYPVIEKHEGEGKSRLLVVNDGSTDATSEILAELEKTRPLLQTVTKTNGGHGPALICGYRMALEQGADYIFQTDSDLQTLAEEFEPFWERRGKYDAVLGMRPDRQDGRARLFVENTLRFILFLIFHVRVPDANAPYRLMKRILLEKYLSRLPEDYNLPNVMLTTFFAYYHENICFRRITFRPRQAGKNSINIRQIAKIGARSLHDFRALRKQMRK